MPDHFSSDTFNKIAKKIEKLFTNMENELVKLKYSNAVFNLTCSYIMSN